MPCSGQLNIYCYSLVYENSKVYFRYDKLINDYFVIKFGKAIKFRKFVVV